MKIVEKSILSTDLAMYFRKRARFIELVDEGEISWQGDDKKECKCNEELVLQRKNTKSMRINYIQFT